MYLATVVYNKGTCPNHRQTYTCTAVYYAISWNSILGKGDFSFINSFS